MYLKILSIALTSVLLSNCSVYKAVNQPDAKDLSVLNKGTQRDVVIAELGVPIHTSGPQNKTVDVFSFVQGYSNGNKTARATWHALASASTAGLWEVIGTPAEMLADGTDVKAKVNYDRNQRVSLVTPIAGAKKLENIAR